MSFRGAVCKTETPQPFFQLVWMKLLDYSSESWPCNGLLAKCHRERTPWSLSSKLPEGLHLCFLGATHQDRVMSLRPGTHP